MFDTYKYKRVLLKISGEALKGGADNAYDAEAVEKLVSCLKDVHSKGIELALVFGAGNLWRGKMGSGEKGWGMDRVRADYMGMLATVMNALCIKDALRAKGLESVLQSSIDMSPVAEKFNRDTAVKALSNGKIVLFAGGTGSPFFTTDTTAALRALETSCEAVLKATKVDGVYTDDPVKNKDAKRYTNLSYTEALSKKLAVMDSTAFSMCSDNEMPIIVFNFSDEKNLEKVLNGDTSIATVVN